MSKNSNGPENDYVVPPLHRGAKVVVRFKPDAGMRLGPAGFSSKNAVDVSGLKGIIEKYPGASVARTFEETEDTIERQVARISSMAGRKLPPLSNYYNITTPDATQAAEMVHDLKQDPLIEEAYIEPPAVPALYAEPAPTGAQEAPPATPDFSPQQGYLDVAPGGIDARHAWTLPGGKGEAVQIIDVEGGWNFNHEDLLQNQGGVVGGTATDDLAWVNHGTAVQGEIGGDEDNPGIVGIAPRSRFSAVSIFGTGNSVAKAIKTAADKLAPGDIILIELHRAGPNANGVGQFGYIPVEWWSADFDAVQYAVAKGILVIAAAGNGSQDLDDAIYEGKFDRSQRDSGAILVGAGAPPTGTFGPDRSRLGFSNYGASIDAQGWGRDVTTAGYGDLQGGSDQNKWYTSTFSGTSSASPIVVGAVANLQGIQKARGGPLLAYQRVRQILRQTGSPQVDGPNGPATQRIGSRPDLRAASALLVPALSVGIATRYWLEAEAYPSGSVRSLWLLVDAAWCRLDNPAPSVEDAVQRAMLGENSQVRVWFQGEEILGLVVQGT